MKSNLITGVIGGIIGVVPFLGKSGNAPEYLTAFVFAFGISKLGVDFYKEFKEARARRAIEYEYDKS
jgi:hypothetical protein